MMRWFFFFLLVIFCFSACRKPALVAVKPVALSDSLLKEGIKIKVSQTVPHYFIAKSKISYHEGEANISGVMYSRLHPDSVLWLRVEKLSFEGLRAVIRTDSVFTWEEQNNKLREMSMDSLSQALRFDLNLKLAQAFVLGNLPFPPTGNETFFKVKEGYLLRQNKDRLRIENYVNPKTLQLTRLIITETTSGNFITLDYENFLLVNKILFPHKITFRLSVKTRSGSQETTLIIEHLKVDFPDAQPAFPFNMDKYRRKAK